MAAVGRSFWLILHPRYNTNTERAAIPTAFLPRLANDEAQTACLELHNWSEGYWNVSVTRDETGVYFAQGWEGFVTDNNLFDKEWMTFHYEGNMRFIVTIFQKNSFVRGPPNSSLFNYAIPRFPPGLLRGVGEVGGSAAGGAAAFNSQFPYFSRVMGRTRQVAIPGRFCREHFSTGIPHEVVLVTPTGNFEVKLIATSLHGEQAHMTRGWTSFRDCNNIQVGDELVFELIGEGRMRVHIFKN